MSEDNKRALPGEEEEVDYLFQARMGVFKWFTRNWKYFAAIAAVVLLVSFVVSAWNTYETSRAKTGAAAVHAVDSKMPKIEPMARMGILPIDDLSDSQRVANLKEGAKRYGQAGDESRGAAAAEAYLKAAGTWERVGQLDQAKASYLKALDAMDEGILGYSARTALAAYDLEAGDTVSALAQYRVLAEREQGLLAEQALIYTASVHAAAGDEMQLQAAYDQFMTRFPASPRAANFDRYPGLKAPALAPAPSPEG